MVAIFPAERDLASRDNYQFSIYPDCSTIADPRFPLEIGTMNFQFSNFQNLPFEEKICYYSPEVSRVRPSGQRLDNTVTTLQKGGRQCQ